MRLLTIVLILIATTAHASITEGGRGVLFGGDHVFAVTAKSGWVLDNESGVAQGVHMIFYPKGETWAQSPVIVYGRAISTTIVANAKQQVEKTVREFRNNGSPNYSSKALPPLTLPNGKKAALYYFSGDQWGNFEAVAYIQEMDTINFLVFNSRTKENFDKYIGDFHQIVKTYQDLYRPPTSIPDHTFENLKRASDLSLSTPGGKDYETKAINAVGQSVANAIGDCTSYMPAGELPSFSYFVRIYKNGNSGESYVFPTNALSACFSGIMSGKSYPPHDFDSFILNLEMKIKP